MSKSRFDEIRDMNIEELSEWFYNNFVFDCNDCMAKDICDKLPNDDETNCVDLVKAWLNEVNVPTLIVGDLLVLDSGNGTTATGVVASDDMVYITDGIFRCIELDKLDYNKILAIYRVAPDEKPELFWERT